MTRESSGNGCRRCAARLGLAAVAMADLSQNMLEKALGIQQPSIYRYETGRTAVPMNVMLLYAEFFDVSLDYIYGRTENRHGMYFSAEPHLERCNPEMDKFIEMCFEPGSAVGAKLKETLKRMMKEEQK